MSRLDPHAGRFSDDASIRALRMSAEWNPKFQQQLDELKVVADRLNELDPTHELRQQIQARQRVETWMVEKCPHEASGKWRSGTLKMFCPDCLLAFVKVEGRDAMASLLREIKDVLKAENYGVMRARLKRIVRART
jgi:hypothetical protein